MKPADMQHIPPPKKKVGPPKGFKQSEEFRRKASLAKKGERNPMWKGDQITVRGGRTRALNLFPDIGPCAHCGNPKSERHHVDGNTLNNDPSNIKPLCRRCHMAEDGRLESFRARGREAGKINLKIIHENLRKQTHCKRGHELFGANIYVYRGARCCKACNRERMRVRIGAKPERYRIK